MYGPLLENGKQILAIPFFHSIEHAGVLKFRLLDGSAYILATATIPRSPLYHRPPQLEENHCCPRTHSNHLLSRKGLDFIGILICNHFCIRAKCPIRPALFFGFSSMSDCGWCFASTHIYSLIRLIIISEIVLQI